MKQLAQTLELEEVLFHRREECSNYDTCLERASEQKWKSFSCQACGDFKQSRPKYVCLTVVDTHEFLPTPPKITREEKRVMKHNLKEMREKEFKAIKRRCE